jgi:site-specific recombinase XerD
MLLSEAQQRFERAKRGTVAESTLCWYRKRIDSLASFLGDVAIQDIEVDDLRRWGETLMDKDSRWDDHPGRPTVAGGFSNWSIRGYFRTIRVFFNFLVKDGCLERSPAAQLELPRRPQDHPKFIKQADALALLEAAKHNPRDRAIVLFLADTGCRVCSIASLCISKMDLDGQVAPNGTVVYFARVKVKSFGGVSRERAVYFGEKTAEALRAYLKVRPQNGSDQVFIGRYGKALKESGFYQVLKRLAEMAGVKENWNPHAFRHGWAYGARMKGADIATVSDSLGHSGIVVTKEFYGQLPDLDIGQRHVFFSWINSVDEDATEGNSAKDDSTEE